MKYRCHFNVEVVSSTEAVKYLYKYIYKGADHSSAAIQAVRTEPDEISQFERLRPVNRFGRGVLATVRLLDCVQFGLRDQHAGGGARAF